MSAVATETFQSVQLIIPHILSRVPSARGVGRESVVGIATVRESNPGGSEIFRTSPERPWGPRSLLYNGYRVTPVGKVAGMWR